ncbi:MAG TPA: NAD(P)H-hydrate dehydratase [Chitinivibrionales bacterium]|nr:NAD(P)H-hydrate dehydratase [Chitinivibrionales bacterium]
MIPVLTVAQMRKIDEKIIGGKTSVGFSYMKEAAAGLFDAARRLVPTPRSGDIVIVCGKGNNGGDGFAAAKLLLDAGYKVMCYVLCQPDELQGEAKLAFEAYDAGEGNFLVLDDVADLGNLSQCSLIIDALLGTGLKGEPHEFHAEVIEAINGANVPVLSVDTPSGLDNDRGVPAKACIRAGATVTMGFPKIGAYFYPGRANVGALYIKDLGYPQPVVEKYWSNIFLPEYADLKKMLPLRKPAGSKFDHGVAFILAGSQGMTGSATLASMSALRTGCGMVHLASPKSAIPVLAAKLTEVVLHSMEETPGGAAAFSASDQVLELMKKASAVCIGPGLSHSEETGKLVRLLVGKCPAPVVLDADGINAFKGKTELLGGRKAPLVITPHAGEWERLFGAMPPEPAGIIEQLRKKAEEFSMTILYKGNPTIIAEASGKAYLSPYGNSGMATAGCGDVLSGIITSLAAQGCSVTDAAVLGAYLHAKAGDEAAKELGEYSMVAGDVEGNIYKAMKAVAK